MNSKILIQTNNLFKNFIIGSQEVAVLKQINIKIQSGEFVIIFGPSGCGKSTFIHTLLGLEKPTKGKVAFIGQDLYSMADDKRAYLRKHKVGTIYQQPLWIKALNVIQNVAFPLALLGMEKKEALPKALTALKKVGMEKWADYWPTELSAGQQQKVSLARALINNPLLLVADEPTGNLDTTSSKELMEMFLTLNQQGKTIVMITHDLEYLVYGSKIFHMVDGQIIEEYKRSNSRRSKITIKGKRHTNNHKEKTEINIRDPNFLKKIKI